MLQTGHSHSVVKWRRGEGGGVGAYVDDDGEVDTTTIHLLDGGLDPADPVGAGGPRHGVVGTVEPDPGVNVEKAEDGAAQERDRTRRLQRVNGDNRDWVSL